MGSGLITAALLKGLPVSPAHAPIHPLVQHARALGPALLADAEDPHAEWLAMVWGPRFDREHALSLWARLSQRQPSAALPVLPALLAVADRFDSLGRPVQHRVRRLILRHLAAVEPRRSANGGETPWRFVPLSE